MNIYMDVAEQAISRKTESRDNIDLLCSRIGLLAGMDKVLMTMRLKNGASFRQMARLTGANEAGIARKIRRLTGQLLDGEYLICLRNRDMFTDYEVDIARDYFLRDLSIREVAIRRRTSRYNIQKTVKKIEKLVAIIKEGNP